MAFDAYGNWISGITQAPVTPPNSLGKLRYGEGAPASDLGNVGDGYINTSNGDYYTKNESGWELQAGGGGGGAGLIGTVDPNGSVTADPGTPYTNRSNHTFWVQENTVSSNTGWVQYV